MKHIKLLFAVAILCAATFVGYNAYTNATMTEEERLMQANLEALSSGENVNDCTGGCKQIGWGFDEILRCDCSYTGWFSCCDIWGCN